MRDSYHEPKETDRQHLAPKSLSSLVNHSFAVQLTVKAHLFLYPCPLFFGDYRLERRTRCLRTLSRYRGKRCPFFLVLAMFVNVKVVNYKWGAENAISHRHLESGILISSV